MSKSDRSHRSSSRQALLRQRSEALSAASPINRGKKEEPEPYRTKISILLEREGEGWWEAVEEEGEGVGGGESGGKVVFDAEREREGEREEFGEDGFGSFILVKMGRCSGAGIRN
ncbi:hypothetical protein LguiB_020770 [Lonicera macranthoides]